MKDKKWLYFSHYVYTSGHHIICTRTITCNHTKPQPFQNSNGQVTERTETYLGLSRAEIDNFELTTCLKHGGLGERGVIYMTKSDSSTI
jgi:hypothetical protein